MTLATIDIGRLVSVEDAFEVIIEHLSHSLKIGSSQARSVVLQYITGRIGYTAWREGGINALSSFDGNRQEIVADIELLVEAWGPKTVLLFAERAARFTDS